MASQRNPTTDPSPTKTQAMPRPEIRAYLEVRKARYDAEAVFLSALAIFANASEQAGALRDAKAEQFRALRALLPVAVSDRIPTCDRGAAPLEDQFVWLPLLVDEFDGNIKAAEVAWALGQRPAAWQSSARNRPD